MKKNEFLSEMKSALAKLSAKDVKEHLIFYSEMIDDKIEEGLSEEEAVASIDAPKDIAAQIMREIKTQKRKTREKRKLKPWEITVLILGSPLWITLLSVGGAVILSIFAVMLSLNLALWALEIPFFIFSLLSQYLIIACKTATKVTVLFSKKIVSFILSFFRGKDAV